MKNIVIYLVILVCLGIGIFFGINNTKDKSEVKDLNKVIEKDKNTTEENNNITKEDQKLIELNNIDKKINYFNYDYLDRYIAFHDSNKDMDILDVIRRVNIGLDQKYYDNTKKTPYPNKDYILVNKYIYMGSDYIPDNLENLDTSYSRSGMKLVSSAKDSLEKMVSAAKSDGYTIRVMSSYRSYTYQVNLYDRYVKNDGVEAADKYSARAGYSEHQTGLCIDVDDGVINYTDFEDSKSFKWMQDNAYKYGFILRYPDGKTDITGYTYESWHYRYVGVDIAEYIKKHNITFDEYYVMFIENKK